MTVRQKSIIVKFKVYRHVPPQTLRGLIPKRYHPQVNWADFESGESVLLLFAHDRKDVVLSSVVRRAIDSLMDLDEQSRVAVAGCFTAEATIALAEGGFRSFTLSDFPWTDDNYKRIRKTTA